jgi:peptide/nickel transport system permease protein
MTRFILRRLLGGVLVLWVVSVITFGVFFMLPSDPAAQYAGRSPSPAVLEATRQKLGLDQPVPVQYATFVKGIFAGREFAAGTDVDVCPAPCLGFSFRTNQPVTTIILDALPVTLHLAFGAAVLWLALGVSIGVLSALRKGSVFDRGAMSIALAGVSLPVYFTGLVALQLLVYEFALLPRPQFVPITADPLAAIGNLVLPCSVLAFLYAALYARLTRANMLETMQEDYIRTARAKGLRERTVITRHGLRAALTPIVTVVGLDIGGLLGGAVLTERVFNFQGLGYRAINAIFVQDLPVVLGVTIVAAAFIVVANLVVDVLYGVIDPRVRVA